MSEEEGQGEYEGRRSGGISLDFVRSPPGLLLVVNIVSMISIYYRKLKERSTRNSKTKILSTFYDFMK